MYLQEYKGARRIRGVPPPPSGIPGPTEPTLLVVLFADSHRALFGATQAETPAIQLRYYQYM
jgi:hypothetical protein